MKQMKGPDDGARDTADSLARAARVQPIRVIGEATALPSRSAPRIANSGANRCFLGMGRPFNVALCRDYLSSPEATILNFEGGARERRAVSAR